MKSYGTMVVGKFPNRRRLINYRVQNQRVTGKMQKAVKPCIDPMTRDQFLDLIFSLKFIMTALSQMKA